MNDKTMYEKVREWKLKNKDKVREQQRRYRLKNKDRLNEYRRNRYKKLKRNLVSMAIDNTKGSM